MEPRAIFLKAYSILAEHAGAPTSSGWAENFADAFVRRPLAHEWRFCGVLGFGGKFYRNDNRYYVTCYREDETPKMRKVITKVNELLKELPYYEPPAV